MTSNQKISLLSWVLVVLITIGIMFWIYYEEVTSVDRFYKAQITDKGFFSIDLRFKKIEQKGGRTDVLSELFVTAKGIENPNYLIAIIHTDASNMASKKDLVGKYDSLRKHFKGINKEIKIPISGSPSWFPFDNLSFDMSIEIFPEADIEIPVTPLRPPFKSVSLYQELEGAGYIFVNPQFIPSKNSGEKDNQIYIKFNLERKLFAKIVFIVYAAFVIIYVVIMLKSAEKIDTLVMPLVGFFVSLWSLRQGLNSFSSGYTTMIDYFFLIVPLVVLLTILARLITDFIKH